MQRRSSPIFLNNNSVSEANAQEQLTEADLGLLQHPRWNAL